LARSSVTHLVERFRRADIVGEGELDRLGAVGDRTAAQGNDEIGLRLARLLGRRDHRATRRMGRHPVEGADAMIAERPAQFVDLVGLAVERAAHHEEDALGLQPFHQLCHGLRRRLAVLHFVHFAENNASRLRHAFLRWLLDGQVASLTGKWGVA